MTKGYVVGLVFAGMGLASLAIGCGVDDETVQEVGALRPVAQSARQIAPLSGLLTGSARPLLRWTGPGVELVQLCSDQDCRHLLSSFAATGGEGRPARPLPTGVAYWRLLARGHHGLVATPTWELFVPGGHGGSASANRGFRYDADADGFADAVVLASGDTGTDTLHVFEGGPHGLRQGRDTMLTLSGFGGTAAAAGDTNGDGFGDVAVTRRPGGVVYGGSATGPGSTPLAVIPVPTGVYNFAFEVAGLGDVNGDGYGDLAVADYFGPIRVYLGGPTGPSTVPAWVVDYSGISRYSRLMTACDCNGDGFGDLVINDSGNGGDVTGFRFFRGGAGGLEDPGAGTFVQRPEFPTGIAGDVDGDGVMDLITAEGLTTTLVLFRGGPGFPGSPAQTIALTERAGALQLGDFDGDGDFDLAATTSLQTSNIYFTDDRLDLYRGGPNGLAPVPVRTIQETSVLPDNQLNFGERLGSADFDGDGREDLLVGAPPPTPTPYFANSPSVVFVFEGSAHGLVRPKPAPRLDGTPGFGAWVSAGGPQSGL